MKNKKGFSSVRTLTLAAMLTAISIVIGIFCKSFLDYGIIRITFENIPIILSGIMFGPWIGAAVGTCADMISYMLSIQKFEISPIITIGAALIGIVSGLIFRIKRNGFNSKRIILAVFLSHTVGSMLVKSAGLFYIYENIYGSGWFVLYRIPLYIVIATIESIIICAMLKNRYFKRYMISRGINYELQ